MRYWPEHTYPLPFPASTLCEYTSGVDKEDKKTEKELQGKDYEVAVKLLVYAIEFYP